ncbi:MAG: adenylyltransferase/cytidyltransferase family protein [Lachnospiraceae bacterium]|nr:adenylyltransferase/cytidyltransferase family protein [Lachnospiraceae bacterium]
MIYTRFEKLTCFYLTDENDEVSFGQLSSILMERPSNVIYCEKNMKLYGIISMGDVHRAYEAGKDFVTVNKCFTSVRPNEYMRVKQIFKDNNKINALPVVSVDNELLGEYSRWDDFIAINDFEQLKANKYAEDFWKKNRRFALVNPCKDFVKKKELMRIWYDNLLNMDVQVSIIDRKDIMDIVEHVDYILFTDEDELRGTKTLYHDILNKKFDGLKAKTYDALGDVIGEAVGDEILKEIISNGVHVFTLNTEDNKREYWKNLQRDILDKYSKIGKKPLGNDIFPEEFREDFYAELYSEEYIKKMTGYLAEEEHIDGISKLKDTDREKYKVKDGERRTLNQPSDYQRCIYFYGPCIIIGHNVADEHTIESYLQARLNEKGYKVKCVNYGAFSDQMTELNRVVSTKLNAGDIVILFNENRKYVGVPSINLIDICEKHKVPATWMLDDPLHSNHKLNSVYADEILKILEPIVQKKLDKKEQVEMKSDFITFGYLERCFHGFAETHTGTIGAIVMNCNPFTLGHRYLIEQAIKQIDHLIIFVVEEDKSVFTFKERFAMVVEGTKDIKNLTVVPSGNFILSQTTFPEYFLKIEDEDIVHNVEYDITLFAEQIAPKLNITYRFVGEELEDRVTNEYNAAMKRILPEHGIHIVEIPRMMNSEQIISASSVRAKLSDGVNTDIDNLIPQTTKEILDACLE